MVTSEVLFERDEMGAPYAIEVVQAARWDDSLLERPSEADARIIELHLGRPPLELPAWLRVELVGTRLAERGPSTGPYATAPATSASVRRLGRALWSTVSAGAERPVLASSLDDFLAAGAAAARHPAPAPAEASRRLDVLARFCRGRPNPLGRIASLEGIALEWWLARRFGDADALAEAVLIARIRESDVEGADDLEFLRLAEVPEGDLQLAELALDRRLLLAQASPWRYFEAGGMAAALAAVRAWRGRYLAAYREHASTLRARATELRRFLEGELRAVRAVERLDRIRALGDPLGIEATTRLRGLIRELAGYEPDGASAPLGREPALFATAERAPLEVRAALERQRERLAAAAVRLVLERPGQQDLDRLLQAIQVSQLDGLERALDDRLAGHIETLLEGALAGAAPATALV